ncbi:hypothetical protein [Candidatus Arsenophonus triatominarum]|uniref:hypothetical protein n=1 Tax=Candidatus Arsenophonus triatominarum TaxID=57911 RepID=UPI0013969628|nr:hypothetical protein [Candidatus Arsenophonus triatominarum]
MVICKIAASNGNRFLGGFVGLGILTFTTCLGLTTGFLGCCFATLGGCGFFACFLGAVLTKTFLR